MVISIPTSQKLLKQSQRLKKFHEQHDGLRVTIVPADELYNEFSSGTPDANKYLVPTVPKQEEGEDNSEYEDRVHREYRCV